MKPANAYIKQLRQNLDPGRLPRHVAIIMDGNGRWAAGRGLPRALGHRAGMESLQETVKVCRELGIDILTVYALSTENWKRPKEEIAILMNLLCEYIELKLDELDRQGIRIRSIGRLESLTSPARQAMSRAEAQTADNTGLILNIALNYGGRREIVDAARELALLVREGRLDPEDIDEELFRRHLYTGDLPDPDLLIRSAGEQRVSNFLLWQVAYTEFVSTDVYWPDFKEAEFLAALIEYQHRKRRFGGL